MAVIKDLYPGKDRKRWENGSGEAPDYHRAIDAYALNSYDDAIEAVQLLANALDKTLFVEDYDIDPDKSITQPEEIINTDRKTRIAVIAELLGALFINSPTTFCQSTGLTQQDNIDKYTVSDVIENIKKCFGNYFTTNDYLVPVTNNRSVTSVIKNIEVALGTDIVPEGSNLQVPPDKNRSVTALISNIEEALGTDFISTTNALTGKSVTYIVGQLKKILGSNFINSTDASETSISVSDFAQNIVNALGSQFISSEFSIQPDPDSVENSVSYKIDNLNKTIEANKTITDTNTDNIATNTTDINSIKSAYLKKVDNDSITENNETGEIQIAKHYRDYLDSMLFSPSIKTFVLLNGATSMNGGKFKVGAPIPLNAFKHAETHVDHIEGNLILTYPDGRTQNVSVSNVEHRDELTYQLDKTTKAQQVTFKLSGIDKRNNAFEESASVSVYVPSFVGATTSDRLSSEEGLIEIDSTSLSGTRRVEISESGGEYVYFMSTTPIKSIKSEGFDVSYSKQDDLLVYINETEQNYHVYRTNELITATLDYVIS